jgi:hypothetical protein
VCHHIGPHHCLLHLLHNITGTVHVAATYREQGVERPDVGKNPRPYHLAVSEGKKERPTNREGKTDNEISRKEEREGGRKERGRKERKGGERKEGNEGRKKGTKERRKEDVNRKGQWKEKRKKGRKEGTYSRRAIFKSLPSVHAEMSAVYLERKEGRKDVRREVHQRRKEAHQGKTEVCQERILRKEGRTHTIREQRKEGRKGGRKKRRKEGRGRKKGRKDGRKRGRK